MSSTDTDQGRALAGQLYDDVIAPLAAARRKAYFPTWGQPQATTYFESASPPTLSPADFEFPGGGDTAALIDALTAAWAAEGEQALAAMAPRLKELALVLHAEAEEGDGSISILCYTMF